MKLNEILENISFHNILIFKKNEQLKLLWIRNERVVRSNMFNNKIISYIDHFDWIDSLKTCLNKKFYIVKYKNKIIGGLGLKNINKISFSAEWAFYISKKSNFIGLAALLEYKAINYFFDNYKLKKLECYVMNHNSEVIKLHKKYGFLIQNNYINRNTSIKISNNCVFMLLTLINWKKIKAIFNKKILKI